jgi:hypothetical protein
MSERTWVWLATLAALALPARVAAQDAATLQRRVDRLAVLRHEATAARARADSMRRQRLDTVRAGHLVVLTLPGEAPLVRQAAPIAWMALDSLFGDDARHLATHPMLFWIMTRPVRYVGPDAARAQAVTAADDATADDVANQLVRGGATAMRSRTDTALANWLGPLLLPPTHADAERARIYVELVTAPSATVRRCYAGNVYACRAALGLVEGDRVTLWYDAAEWRAMVRRATQLERVTARAAVEACLTGQSDAACLDIVHALPGTDPPLSAEARHSLTRVAFTAGGRDAHGRLLRGAGRPLDERLAAAAGLPSDTLVQRWRETILSARPKPVTLSASGGWMALGWAVVFGLLALRSSRWR